LALVAVGLGLVSRVPDASADDIDPVSYWSEARVRLPPDPTIGPVQIAVSYTIAADQTSDWLAAMQQLRRSRLRTGATRWELYRDAEHPHRYVEQFWVPTWEEHPRQHDGRLTGAARTIETAALGFSDPPATAVDLLPPTTDADR